MKNLKLKSATIMIFSVILISTILISGCSKQDKKDTLENKEKKTENVQQQNTTNSIQSDSSKQMNNDNTDMNKDDKSKMDMGKGNLEHKMIKIPSAQCDICKEKITKALKKVNGVKTFEVDIDNKIVHVNFDKTVTELTKIENAITVAGYDANNKKANPDAYAKLDDCCKKPEDRKNHK